MLFEKYHTFERPLSIKEIVRALSRSLRHDVYIDSTKTYRQYICGAGEREKELLPRIAFLNKFENDDDNFFYHIFRGAIWYIPVKDVASLFMERKLGGCNKSQYIHHRKISAI